MKRPSKQLDFLNEADNRWVNLPQPNKEAILEIMAILLVQMILPKQEKQSQNQSGDSHDQ